ncbi:aspartyl-phosphate phosphatase Spo0E family protein [Brevibacillus laterosporus]|nr:aspartyl-phosphate phosphatase Spo0E family protein [Brevibacillus laterosporus]
MEKDIPQLPSTGTSSFQSLHCATTLSQNDDLEVVRQKLVELFIQEGSFSSPAVLQLSQQLDEYIVAIQKNYENNKVTVNVE